MSSWHAYTSPMALGHRMLRDLTSVELYATEKIDGSQFSFGVFDGELKIRSKGQQMLVEFPEKMFSLGIAEVVKRKDLLTPGWMYTGEYLQKPKHNVLAYDRVPKGHVILFDIRVGEEDYLPYEEMVKEAARIDLEVVPRYWQGMFQVGVIEPLLEKVSVLGGQKIEGVVLKQVTPTLFSPDKKALMAKYVSSKFKEVHAQEWKAANPGQNDILGKLIDQYRTPARWAKARQHLREQGKLQDAPQDIPLLMQEVTEDVDRECSEEIQKKLMQWAWGHVRRGIVKGLPEWYKEELAGSVEVVPVMGGNHE